MNSMMQGKLEIHDESLEREILMGKNHNKREKEKEGIFKLFLFFVIIYHTSKKTMNWRWIGMMEGKSEIYDELRERDFDAKDSQ